MNPTNKIQFSTDFESMLNAALKTYDDALDKLQDLMNGQGYEDGYGVCNTRYQLIQIKPTDISTYVSNLFKATGFRLIEPTASDLEKFSVEMAKQFALDNGGPKLAADNMFATSTYVDVRTQTLMDILVQSENTFFDRSVYSVYEMKERAKDMKRDFDTMKGMRLSVSLKAVAKALPGIIEKQLQEPGYGCCCGNLDIITRYIETFMLFAVSLNTCTIMQMSAYISPRTTFVRKDKPGMVHEAAEMKGFIKSEDYKPIFIVLSSGKSKLAGPIMKITKSKWSHCTISFDADMSSMYSYGARLQDDPENPNKMSMKRENLKAANMDGLDICVFATYIPNDKYQLVRSTCEEKYKNRDNTKFDLFLLIKKALNDNTHGSTNDGKKICTTFVNDLIKLCGKGFSDKAVPSPQQMRDSAEAKPDKCILVYEGISNDYDVSKVNEKLHAFEHKKISKPFVEYFTECCLVNTDDVQIRSKIPFDINMKNIVLNDMTNGFKETKTALHFILKDERSPIHGMLMKYATCKRLANSVECGPTLGLFRPYFGRDFDPMIEQYRKMSFDTNLNWLDQIAYGNQFLDGNYRMDAMGNEQRHPIRQTLCMVHKMYCSCGLKTNEELANNILKIAGVMHAVICEGWALENRDLVRDILVVLGDCFTRNVIKLYHNNTVIIVHDDTMDDTMIPGYAYLEQFVYQEADGDNAQGGGQQSGGSSIQSSGIGQVAQNVAAKTGVLSKLSSTIRQFIQWVQTKLANFPAGFAAATKAQTVYINGHKQLNETIAAALANQDEAKRYKCTLKTPVPTFKISTKEFLPKVTGIKDVFKDYADGGKSKDQVDAIDIKARCYPGNEADNRTWLGNIQGQNNKQQPQQTQNQKQQTNQTKQEDPEATAVQNIILFGTTKPSDDQKGTNGDGTPRLTELTSQKWNEIISVLTSTQKLMDEFAKAAKDGLKGAGDVIDALRKKQESDQQKQQQSQQQGDNKQQQVGNDRADQLFGILQDVSNNLCVKTLNNTFANNVFKVYYKIYKDVIDDYQSKTRSAQQNTQQNTQQQPAAATPEAGAANANPATPAQPTAG